MLKVDLHVHSDYSDGHDSIPRLIKAAKAKSLDILGIVDHGPGHSFGIRPEEIDKRNQEILEKADLFGIDVRMGIELDLDSYEIHDKKLWDNSFDLVLGSIHKRCRYAEYFQAVKDSISMIDILAHHGWVIADYNDEIELKLIDLLYKNDVAIEINSRRGLPWLSFIRLCADAGLRYTIGSDAHRAIHVGNVEWAENIAKEYFNDGDIYIG